MNSVSCSEWSEPAESVQSEFWWWSWWRSSSTPLLRPASHSSVDPSVRERRWKPAALKRARANQEVKCCRVVAGDVWCWWIRRYRTRHGRRIKVRWLWIVTMVLRDHNRHWTPPWQSWGWPPARCLVNRRRTPPPEAEAHRGVIGYRSVVRVDIVLWVRVIVLLVPASSCSTSAVDFYANVQWEPSRARAVFNRLC